MNEKVKVETPEQAEVRAYCRQWLENNKQKPFPGDLKKCGPFEIREAMAVKRTLKRILADIEADRLKEMTK